MGKKPANTELKRLRDDIERAINSEIRQREYATPAARSSPLRWLWSEWEWG